MKKHLLKLSFLIVTASMFCACDSFLDKQPSATSDAPITEVSQLLSLYDYVTNTYEYDYPGVYATDDYGVPLALYDASPITFGADQMSLYALSSEVMETTTGNNVWEYEYAKIFNANTIIASVGSVNGSQEEKDEALCNAYLMRGWSFFRLATVCHTVRPTAARWGCRCVWVRFSQRISRVLRWGRPLTGFLMTSARRKNTVWWTGYRKALPGGRPNVPFTELLPACIFT